MPRVDSSVSETPESKNNNNQERLQRSPRLATCMCEIISVGKKYDCPGNRNEGRGFDSAWESGRHR